MIRRHTRDEAPRGDRSTRRHVAALVAFALVVGFLAAVKVTVTGGGYGIYLLARGEGRPLELKDDLRLGDGPRLLWGFGFEDVREMLSSAEERLPRLDLEWDEGEGSGIVTNRFADGRTLQTLFSRYVEDGGGIPHGLFVGGALPQVASVPAQNQSGMALHDARGWHHVWCTVNELLLDDQLRGFPPAKWRFVASRVLIETPERIVLQSEHMLDLVEGPLRVERYAYFRAGLPFFRLGINMTNLGDRPIKVTYLYGDEPWVGEFGSAKGNYGWLPGDIVPRVSFFDTRANPWAGIVDSKTGVANFLSWEGAPEPDVAYFGNHAGTPMQGEEGQPLISNEVAIGLEWRGRTIAPGASLDVRLAIGLADSSGPVPSPPPEALNPR